MDSEDERVAVVDCNSILDRAFGKPGFVKEEEKDSLEARIANMTARSGWPGCGNCWPRCGSTRTSSMMRKPTRT